MSDFMKEAISPRDKVALAQKSEDDKLFQYELSQLEQDVWPLASEFGTPIQLGKVTTANIEEFTDIILVALSANSLMNSADDEEVKKGAQKMENARKMLNEFNHKNP